ncbi:MAG: DUF1838 domain-containing protein [Gammaproteobacteria bacterium]|nr:DUF1838 domain-containing protein [Gammaproteobacteria bacterium]
MSELSRRAVIMGTGGLLVASVEGALPEFAPGVAPGSVDLASPEANLANFIRMMASLEEEDCPWWYNGTVYAVIGETMNPKPLFRYSGMELYLITHLDDGSYELTGNTVTFFRTLDGSDWLHTYENPFTGAKNEVGAAIQGGGPGRGFNLSVDGVRFTKFKDQIPDEPLKKWWNVAAGKVWMNNDTVYPPGLPAPRAQSQSMFVDLKDFRDSSIARLDGVFSSTVTMPWLHWMDMDDHEGHLLWHAAGAKLPGLDALPAEYRKRAEVEYPERMTVARQ